MRNASMPTQLIAIWHRHGQSMQTARKRLSLEGWRTTVPAEMRGKGSVFFSSRREKGAKNKGGRLCFPDTPPVSQFHLALRKPSTWDVVWVNLIYLRRPAFQ